MLNPLPIPSDAWLRNKNELYGGEDMPLGKRPIRALEDWAAEHGQPLDLLSQLGGAPWHEIDGFFTRHTNLVLERSQPVGRSAWFYKGSFFPIHLPVIVGLAPSTEIDLFSCVASNMPIGLLQELSRDEHEVRAYEEHLCNAVDSLACSSVVIGALKVPFATEMLTAAETELDSAVTDLLNIPPNGQGAIRCRSAFEKSLKGFLAEANGLTEREAGRQPLSHRLDTSINRIAGCSGNLISNHDMARLKDAAMDSTLPRATRRLFPDHDDSYRITTLPSQRRLWGCYAVAQCAFTTVLRAFGASDSRRQI